MHKVLLIISFDIIHNWTRQYEINTADIIIEMHGLYQEWWWFQYNILLTPFFE